MFLLLIKEKQKKRIVNLQEFIDSLKSVDKMRQDVNLVELSLIVLFLRKGDK